MKKNYRVKSRIAYQNRIPSPRAFDCVRTFEVPLDHSTSRADEDKKDKKRVKSHDTLNDCRMPLSGFQEPRSDEPKTSEYAFFKKLKSDTNHRFPSQSLHKAEIEPNKFKSSIRPRAIKNLAENDVVVFRPSFTVERAGSINHGFFCLPVDGTPKNSETDLKQAFTALEANGRKDRDDPMHERTIEHADLFSTKRQKLRQWATEAFPEIGQLCLNGNDLVAMLLSRLSPATEDRNVFKIPKSREADNYARSEFLASEWDPSYTKFHQTSIGSFPCLEHMQCMDMSRERFCPSSELLDCHVHRSAHVSSNLNRLSLGYKKPASISYVENGSDCSSSFERCSQRCRLIEHDEFFSPDKSPRKRESRTLLLGWQPMSWNHKVTGPDVKSIRYPPPILTSHNHNQWRMDYRSSGLGTGQHSTPVFLSDYASNMFLLPPFGQDSNTKHESGTQLLQDKDMVSDLDDFPLTLSCALPLGNVTNDYFHDRGNHHPRMSRTFSAKHEYLSLEVPLPCGFNIHDQSLKSLCEPPQENHLSGSQAPIFSQTEIWSAPGNEDILDANHWTTSHCEDMVKTQNWSSFYYLLSPDYKKSFRLVF